MVCAGIVPTLRGYDISCEVTIGTRTVVAIPTGTTSRLMLEEEKVNKSKEEFNHATSSVTSRKFPWFSVREYFVEVKIFSRSSSILFDRIHLFLSWSK